jgi:hypothetical protein
MNQPPDGPKPGYCTQCGQYPQAPEPSIHQSLIGKLEALRPAHKGSVGNIAASQMLESVLEIVRSVCARPQGDNAKENHASSEIRYIENLDGLKLAIKDALRYHNEIEPIWKAVEPYIATRKPVSVYQGTPQDAAKECSGND